MGTERLGIGGAVSLMLLAGCSSMSLKETSIRSKIPDLYRGHVSGIIVGPSDSDIQAAIDLGKLSKDSSVLGYAYVAKPDINTYVTVLTPLYLIADRARDCARRYEEVDQDFVAYCRSLDAVKIGLSRQVVSTVTFNAYSWQHQVILLRDGVRVPSLGAMPGYGGGNPFVKPDPQVQALLQASVQNMPPESRAMLNAYYAALGMNPDGTPRGGSGEVILTELDSVFAASELRKAGRYEIIFRTAPSANLLHRGDREVRFEIDFSVFR